MVKDRDDVLVLGIALEKNNSEELRKVISKNNITWDNYWVEQKYTKSLHSPQNRFKIGSYPTYLILNSNGEVIF